ncbi:uncharacterized protein PG998_009551 [Apiospora kogelbergensis]
MTAFPSNATSGGNGGNADGQEAQVSFSVQINYVLAAFRDDIPDNWTRNRYPPPLMYLTAKVSEADVGRFAGSYIESLILQTATAYNNSSTNINAGQQQGPVTNQVTNNTPAGADWGVDINDLVSLPEWLRRSIPAGNRWLGVRITTPVLPLSDPGSPRYLAHLLGSIADALALQAPDPCSITVSVGASPRGFSLARLQKLAAGFLVTGSLLSTLPSRSPPGLSSGETGKGGKERDTAHANDSKQLFEEPRVIFRGTLPREAPSTQQLHTTVEQLFAATSAEEVVRLMASSLPQPLTSIFHQQPQQDQQLLKVMTIDFWQLPATTDADSVAIWCDLVSRLVGSFLT